MLAAFAAELCLDECTFVEAGFLHAPVKKLFPVFAAGW